MFFIFTLEFFSLLTENFSDEYFNNNPKWTVDTLEFIVNSDFSTLNEVFSPDNDGCQDIAVFLYNLPTMGMVGNALIYYNRGRLIKQVLNNKLLSASGEFFWDGINEYGQKASVRIY